MILLYIYIFILLLYYAYIKKWNPNRPIFYPKKDMIIIGHRGSPYLEKENTLKSFKKAFDAGVDGIELDVQILKDGKLIVFHDWDLYNINGSYKKITDMYYSDILNLQNQINYKIPLLNEVLEILPHKKFINIEIKSNSLFNKKIVNKVINTISKYNIENFIIISSFNPFVLFFINKINSNLATAYILSTRYYGLLFNTPLWMILCKPDCLHIDINDVNKNIILWARQKKLSIFAFTVNSLTELEKANKFKLDGIFTDNPYIKI